MGYCFMSIDKIKTGGQLRAKYNHNYRMVDVSNADPDKKHLNENLFPYLLLLLVIKKTLTKSFWNENTKLK